jgi:hypothetical protein
VFSCTRPVEFPIEAAIKASLQQEELHIIWLLPILIDIFSALAQLSSTTLTINTVIILIISTA